MTIQLNDTQLVIVNRAVARGNIVPAWDKNFTSASYRSYVSSVNALIKKGVVDVMPGLKGSARDGDYVEADNRRLFLTPSFLKSFFDDASPAPATETVEDAPKARKATKAAAKPVEPVEVASEAHEDAIEDLQSDSPKSIVAESYRQGYAELKAVGASGQGCNDAVDQFLRGQFMGKINGKGRERLDVDALIEFAIANDVWSDKWALLNNGQKRMNVANAVRRALAKGRTLKHGKKALKAA
jgi:hypothetical protein